MSDEFLKALGQAGRRERDGADEALADAPKLDDVAKERMVAAALGALGKGTGEPVRAEKPAPRERARRPRLVAAGALSALLLAAGVALFVGSRKDPLPSYSASVRGGTEVWRGEPAPGAPETPLVVRADGELEIVLRPAEPVRVPLKARAFATKGDVVRSLPADVSGQGTARVAGRVDALLGAGPEGIGPWRVTLLVGDSVPADLPAAQSRDDLRRVVVPVTVVPSSPTGPSVP